VAPAPDPDPNPVGGVVVCAALPGAVVAGEPTDVPAGDPAGAPAGVGGVAVCAPAAAPRMIVEVSAPTSTHERTNLFELFNDPTLFLRGLVRALVFRVPVMQMATLAGLVDRGNRGEQRLRILRIGRFHTRGGRLPQTIGP
jgi:hypothetical protein